MTQWGIKMKVTQITIREQFDAINELNIDVIKKIISDQDRLKYKEILEVLSEISLLKNTLNSKLDKLPSRVKAKLLAEPKEKLSKFEKLSNALLLRKINKTNKKLEAFSAQYKSNRLRAEFENSLNALRDGLEAELNANDPVFIKKQHQDYLAVDNLEKVPQLIRLKMTVAGGMSDSDKDLEEGMTKFEDALRLIEAPSVKEAVKASLNSAIAANEKESMRIRTELYLVQSDYNAIQENDELTKEEKEQYMIDMDVSEAKLAELKNEMKPFDEFALFAKKMIKMLESSLEREISPSDKGKEEVSAFELVSDDSDESLAKSEAVAESSEHASQSSSKSEAVAAEAIEMRAAPIVVASKTKRQPSPRIADLMQIFEPSVAVARP